MKNSLGIIFTGREDVRLNQLTQKRSAVALPIAGRYRLIDFALSNMVNSNIINVGIPTQYNYSSLMDHLGSGSEWDLSRKTGGLFILPPFVSKGSDYTRGGDIDLLFGIMAYIRRSNQKYVVLSDGNIIYNTSFCDLERFHMDSNADITLMYNHISPDSASDSLTMLHLDDSRRVTQLEINPPASNSRCAYMNVMVMEKTLLESLVDGCVSRGEHDITMDILLKNVGNLRIFGYEYSGYVGRVDSVESYFKINMDLLDYKIRQELFDPTTPIYTKTKDQVPAKYGQWAETKNCLIADGCIIDGEVENSIVFRGVRIAKGTKIKNSILMQDTYVHEGCSLEYTIVDKDVNIRENIRLAGQPNYPVIIPKGATV